MEIQQLYSAGMLVYAALLFQAAGFAVRDELLLRLLVLTGTLFHISYYFFYPEIPLWGAILASSLLGIINLILIAIIIRERTLLAITQADMMLFNHFGKFMPGQFRRIMRIASRQTAAKPTTLTTEGLNPDKLCYVTNGGVSIEKAGSRFHRDGHLFIGEIGFLYSVPASATVTVDQGASFVEWDADKLRGLMKRHPALENAMIATLSYDLARKVATSNPCQGGERTTV